MRKLLIPTAAVVAGFLAAGCGSTSTTGGGGTKGTKADGAAVDKNDTFTVKAPGTKTIKQGTKENLELSLDRGKDFKESVKLAAESPPKGLTVTFASATIEASAEGKAIMAVEAAKDAPLGEHTITVKATPGAGKATEVPVKVKVEAP